MPEMQGSCRKSFNGFDSLTMQGQAGFFVKSEGRAPKKAAEGGPLLGLPNKDDKET